MKKTIIISLAIFLLTGSSFAQEENAVSKFLNSGDAYAKMFFEYFYMQQGDDTYPGRSHFSQNETGDNAFSFRRVYLGYEHTFSEKFLGKVQMQMTDLTMLEKGQRAFFLKEANITWKNIYPLADLIIGHSLTPVWSIGG
ncbi:MAG: hypothetical protein U5L09_21845 [Bacteroidales bacterium]|nr:hypothetical protein [Bacteroidales bacterium]